MGPGVVRPPHRLRMGIDYRTALGEDPKTYYADQLFNALNATTTEPAMRTRIHTPCGVNIALGVHTTARTLTRNMCT